jgi:hypothetical protein
MAYTPPPDYGHQQQADAERIKQAQEAQRIAQEVLEADKQAREIAERQAREREQAAADQANRIGWSGQQR